MLRSVAAHALRRLLVTLATVHAAGLIAVAADQLSPHEAARLSGAIVDEGGGGVADVTVVAFNASLGIRRVVVTTESGAFAIPLLPPGAYIVTTQTPSFAPVEIRNVELRPRDHLFLTVRLRLKAEDATVHVVGTPSVIREAARPTLTARGGAVEATLIDGALQRLLPLSSRRDWADIFRLTSGTVSGLEYGGTVRYHWRGSDAGAHAFLIDGIDVTSAFANTGRLITLTTAAIQDVRIGSGVTDVAFPLAAGAVIEVRTRGGTNRTSGDLGLVVQPQEWNADNARGGASATLALLHTEAAIGGALRPDRAWWFGATHEARQTIGLSRSAQQVAAIRALTPGFEAKAEPAVARSAFAKITSRIRDAHHLSAFFEHDANPQEANSRIYAGDFVKRIYGGSSLALSLNSVWTPAISGRLSVSYNNKSAPTRLVRDDLPSRPVHRVMLPSGSIVTGGGAVAILGNASSAIDTPYDTSTIAGDVIYERNSARPHRLQFGTLLQPRLHEQSIEKYANGGFALEELVMCDPDDPGAGLIPFHRRIFTTPQATIANTDSHDYAFYLQDVWRASGRLTIGAGIRTDIVGRTDRLVNEPIQRSREVAPRANAAYVIDRDRRHVVRATWGRIQEALSVNAASPAFYRPSYRDMYDTNLDGRFDVFYTVPSLLSASPTRTVDSHRHQPFVDEWTVGHAWQIDSLTTAAATFARRAYRDRNALLETNAIYRGSQFVGYRNPSVNQTYEFTNNVWNWPVYSSLELELATTRERVQLRSTYSRQWRHLAGTWQPGDPAALLQPGAFPNHRGLGRINAPAGSVGDANSLSGFSMLDGSQWRDHVLTVTASGLTRFGLRLATSYTFQSGPWSGPIVAPTGVPPPWIGSPVVVLSTGRAVANPLATATRFAYPTRGEGQFTLPSLHLWNIRVGRVFPLRASRIEMAVDVLNVINGSADQALESGGNVLGNPLFGTGWLRQPPRAAQVSVRVAF